MPARFWFVLGTFSLAILVTVDTEPLILPLRASGLYFVLNSPWDIVRDGENGNFFLCTDGHWLTAPELGAEWQWATQLPASFEALRDSNNLAGARACLPDSLEVLALNSPFSVRTERSEGNRTPLA